jgi:hypothetical protein
VEPLAAEQLAAGLRVVEPLAAGLRVVEPLVAELRVVELLAGEPDVRPERLSFAALYSLAVAVRKNQCWS